jgi:glycine/D-amino acid oxidase-like deaminating enzyme/nitrite reductase/ring-hydroxylating ferredoxin subunit
MPGESYWIDTAALPTFPALDRDLEVEVLVVGAGITGITAAYLLKNEGRTVALIDRGRAAMADTGHTTAHVTCVTDLRLSELEKKFGRDHAQAVWDAGCAALAQIESNIDSAGIDCEWRRISGFQHASIVEDRDEREDFQKEASLAAELGFDAEYVEAVPHFHRPGMRIPNQAKFHPRKYLAGLIAKIPGGGSHVFEMTAAEEFEGNRISANGFSINARYVVVATHNPLPGRAGVVATTLLQTKLALYSTYAIGAKLPSGQAAEALYWDTTDPYFYLRLEHYPDHDYAIFGGEDHKTGQADDTVARFQNLENLLVRFFPDAQVDHRWSGQVIETNDGLPFIGENATDQFVATGFAGNGMTFGTLAGIMARDAALKRQNPWTDLFDPHRKKILGGAWDYLRENKDYPFYLLKSRLAAPEGKSLDSLKRGEGKILVLEGRKVAAFRDEQGAVGLVSPVCTHMGCHVNWNDAEKTWDCPCHGSRFTPDGLVIGGPAEAPLKPIAL